MLHYLHISTQIWVISIYFFHGIYNFHLLYLFLLDLNLLILYFFRYLCLSRFLLLNSIEFLRDGLHQLLCILVEILWSEFVVANRLIEHIDWSVDLKVAMFVLKLGLYLLNLSSQFVRANATLLMRGRNVACLFNRSGCIIFWRIAFELRVLFIGLLFDEIMKLHRVLRLRWNLLLGRGLWNI